MGVTGAKAHIARLKRLSGPAMVREAGKAVFALADLHVTDAALSITAGSVSGKNHVASRPGQPPNSDTHLLDRSIRAEKTGPLKAKSLADAPYAIALEKGTSKMAERPFMKPAAVRVRGKVDRIMKAAVKRVIQGGSL